jgi:hypothetical protein
LTVIIIFLSDYYCEFFVSNRTLKTSTLIGDTMYRSFIAAVTLAGVVTSAGMALAQTYPPSAYNPAYNPYYPQYTAPAPPAYYAPAPYPYSYDGTHSSGTAGRAYYGGQKTN